VEMIRVGDEIPDVQLFRMGERGVERITSRAHLGTGRVVLFGLPGAFTGTCSREHLPGYVERAEALRAAGADRIVCLAVNDPFVLAAWSKAGGAAGRIDFLADSDAALTKAMGLDVDRSEIGLGIRCRRFAALLDGGRVVHLAIEPGKGITVCGGEHLLDALERFVGER